MKKIFILSATVFMAIALSSCSNKNSALGEEIHEGRISTHTTKSHQVHQVISAEEAELAKERITSETAPGVSYKNIDAEGAKMINEHRKNK